MEDPWGDGGFKWGEKPNIKQIVKKKKKKKIWKSGKIEKKNWIFFFTENGLNCIKNPTKHL